MAFVVCFLVINMKKLNIIYQSASGNNSAQEYLFEKIRDRVYSFSDIKKRYFYQNHKEIGDE